MLTLLIDLKIAKIGVKFIRCDYSRENKPYDNACCANGNNINFEFSGAKKGEVPSSVVFWQ
jgi:hypothetical protein